jgi:hypothetical protein
MKAAHVVRNKIEIVLEEGRVIALEQEGHRWEKKVYFVGFLE